MRKIHGDGRRDDDLRRDDEDDEEHQGDIHERRDVDARDDAVPVRRARRHGYPVLLLSAGAPMGGPPAVSPLGGGLRKPPPTGPLARSDKYARTRFESTSVPDSSEAIRR